MSARRKRGYTDWVCRMLRVLGVLSANRPGLKFFACSF